MENNTYQSKGRKIFVGGLSADLTEDEFKKYFEKFGRITDVVVMHDSVTSRPRGFGFITFDSVESVDSVLQNSFHELNGRRVEVKRAVPKKGNCNSSHTSNARTRRGKSPPLPNGNVSLSYPYYGSNYVVYPGYTPFPHYGGLGADLYGPSLYGSWYTPNGLYGIGHEIPPMASGGVLYGPNFFGVGTYPFPYINSLIHPTYSSKGGRLLDTVAGNGIADTRRNVEIKQPSGNVNMSADAVPFQIKDKA